MADLTEIQASQSVKIIGSGPTGVEDTPVEATTAGGLHINLRDNSGAEIGVIANPLITNANIESGQLVPTITNQFRIRLNTTNVTVPATYTTLFTRSGNGLFFGFQTAFNNANIDIRLTIDSGIIFELNLNDIKQFQFNDTTTTRMQMGGFLSTVGNTLDFSSKFAIPYDTGVTLEIKRSDGTNHINTNWIVFLTED